MKKSLFLLIAIILAGLVTKPVHATTETIISGDGTWWGIKELASYYNQKNNEREALCLSDINCHDEMLAHAMSDVKYGVGYQIFQEKRFVISSINRETSNIEVYFNNDDINVSKYNAGYRDSDARKLFIGWFEEDENQLFRLSDEELLSSTGTGQHTLISQSNSTGLFPSQSFIPIAFNENPSGRIGYMVGSVFFRGREVIDISECLANSDWVSCDLFASPSGETRYFTTVNVEEVGPEIPPAPEPVLPDEPVIDPIDPSIEPEPTPNEPNVEPTIVPVPQPEPEPAEVSEANLEITENSITASENEAPMKAPVEEPSEILEKGNETASIDVPLTSNTITSTAKKCNKNEFPWWFIILVLAGDAVILWFFLPKRHEKR